MDSRSQLHEIARLCRAQNEWRGRTINLIASENVLSPAARALLDSDFHHRYAEGHPGARYYEGTRYIDEVEARTHRLVSEIFHADRVDVRLPSGTMANEAVFSALMKDGGTALVHGVAGGGHISHAWYLPDNTPYHHHFRSAHGSRSQLRLVQRLLVFQPAYQNRRQTGRDHYEDSHSWIEIKIV